MARYAETDQMGIVHHSVYAIWFEAARTEFIREAGISYSECEERGLMLPLVFLECNFEKPAYYEDVVSVEVSIEKMTPVRMTMKYKVTNKTTGEELAAGRTGHVWTNSKRQPVNLKKHDPEIYEIINQCI
ncbi:MAG: acyl-CoA thioesterase [Clostridia bacterium]